MMNSAIFQEHRRKGIYSKLVNETLRWASERGFQTVYSRHVCSNNAVIIPKLKRGFLISGLEMTDDFGALVRLTYFLNETRRKGFDFRTGLSDSPETRKALKL